ncbi:MULTISPECIES: hypothetical protein [Hydrocarboniphaga]|jgi:hypothetical protein|uniref:Lipoprotein n=1 Tax=Hydrocarboniphaga effusa AP103 TaxID=1172194 RepID=I8T153_9GAMM|nr:MULTISPECIES: hypothetical protein [Hydrocarboniphaga]EIT67610.1 hypothetical protein WQQ_40450 [Hydrocarboniphaga effusa AP103]MDZ4080195.1 hypothetical protein [Hydrocarboniphaga sp.]
MKNPIALACAAALLGACASAPQQPLNARPVPADRLLAYQDPIEGGATLVLVRQPGDRDSECFIIVSVGGTPAAVLAEAETAELHLPAGRQKLELGRTGIDDCNKDKNFGSTMGGSFAAGEVQRVALKIERATIDMQNLPSTTAVVDAPMAEAAKPVEKPKWETEAAPKAGTP